jgi:signal transduction histidine kinase
MKAWNATPISWLILLLGTITALIGAWQVQQQVQKEAHASFTESARLGRSAIERRLQEYQSALTSLQSLYNTYGLVSRDEAQHFLTQLQTIAPHTNRLPGLMLLEYEAKSNHFKTTPVYQPPAQHFAQDIANLPAFNFDSRDLQLSNEPNSANATGRVATVQGPKDIRRQGLGFRLPVYRVGWPLETAVQRQAAYLGTVGTWFDINTIFNDVLAESIHRRLRLQVYIEIPPLAVGEVMQHRLLFDSQTKSHNTTSEQWIERSSVNFAGQNMMLVMSSTESNWLLGTTRYLGLIVFNIGLIISVLIFLLVRQRLERQLGSQRLELAHFSRLSALGELSSAIAHEIRQPLAAMQAYLDGCLRKLADGRLHETELQKIIGKTMDQALRAQNIIMRVQQAVRREKEDAHPRERLTLAHLLESVNQLARIEVAKTDVTLNFAECPTAYIHVVAMDIELALLNLIRNAIQALQSVHNGQVHVKTTIDQTQATIEVIDNGSGLSAEVMQTLFEPHQTSKADGTGMGLRISRYLAENNGGKLIGGNTQKGGAVFALILPLVQ